MFMRGPHQGSKIPALIILRRIGNGKPNGLLKVKTNFNFSYEVWEGRMTLL